MHVLAFLPTKLSRRMRVSLEPRNGMCCSSLPIARMHSLRARSDLLIFNGSRFENRHRVDTLNRFLFLVPFSRFVFSCFFEKKPIVYCAQISKCLTTMERQYGKKIKATKYFYQNGSSLSSNRPHSHNFLSIERIIVFSQFYPVNKLG